MQNSAVNLLTTNSLFLGVNRYKVMFPRVFKQTQGILHMEKIKE